MISAAGELRASRTFGLKATPRTPPRAPRRARPRSFSASATRSTTWRGIARLMSPASSTNRSTNSNSRARPGREDGWTGMAGRPAPGAGGPPGAGAGGEGHDPERLRGGRVDDLPDVDAHPLGQQGELVHERDV